MPPLPDVPNVLRADLQWSFFGASTFISRQFFRYSGGAPTATDATNLAADIYSAMAAESVLWASTVGFEGVKVTDLATTSGGQGEHAQSTTGTRGASVLPASTSLLVSYLITRRYRGGKPRSYFPWGIDGDLNNTTAWHGTFLTTANSSLSTYLAAVIGLVRGTTTITQHVNVSYYNGFTVVTNPITGRSRNVPTLRTTPIVDDIVSFASVARIGTQRRRNRLS